MCDLIQPSDWVTDSPPGGQRVCPAVEKSRKPLRSLDLRWRAEQGSDRRPSCLYVREEAAKATG